MKYKLTLAATVFVLATALILFVGTRATPTEQLPDLSQDQPYIQLTVPLPSTPPPAPELFCMPELQTDPEPAQAPPKRTSPQTKPPEQCQLSPSEQAMLTLINNERIANDLPILLPHVQLIQLARLKSQDIIDYDYWDHTSPTYGTPKEMMTAAGIEFDRFGENLAKAPCYESAHGALMDSEGHRENLLRPIFTHIGIGIIENGSQGVVITQLFLKP